MAFASAHNGGKTQVNIYYDFYFLNALKNAQGWSYADGSGVSVTPDFLDANGYPTSIAHTGYSTVLFVPPQLIRPGNYLVSWTGNGTINLIISQAVLPTATFTGSVSSGVLTAGTPSGGTIQKGMRLSTGGIVQDQLTGSAGVAGTYSLLNGIDAVSQSMTVSGGSLTGSGGSGRYVFAVTGSGTGRFDFRITATPVTNVVICHVDDEALIAAGNVFATQFKNRLIEGRFGVLRAMDVWNSNLTNMTNWASRKPTTYFSYAASELRSSIYAGVTTNTANAYVTASFPPAHSSDGTAWTSGSPKDKDTVTVLFNANAANSPCTLDVGTTGTAINILNAYSGALSSGGNDLPLANKAGTLTYDAQLNAWIKKGADVDQGTRGINGGWPPEIALQLCAEVGAHPHLVMPPYALTPMSDFVTQLATYIQGNMPGWMVPRFEGPNELWNTAVNFNNTGYANAVATSYGWGADYQNWYGKAISTIGQAVSAVYAGDRTKYAVLCGVQGATTPSSSNARLDSTKYVLQSPQVGYLADHAYNWVTHVMPASYFNPSDNTGAPKNIEAALMVPKVFTASLSGGVMTVTAILLETSGAFSVGDTVYGSSVFADNPAKIPIGTKITSFTGANAAQAITAISLANPAVVSVTTPPANGSSVYIQGAATNGMTQLANGWYTSAGATANSYQLSGINSSGFSAYSGTGATSRSLADFGTINISYSGTLASQSLSAATDPSQAVAFSDTCNSGGGAFIISVGLSQAGLWKTWAQGPWGSGVSIQKMCAYEGGYSCDFTGGGTLGKGDSQVDMLRQAGKANPHLYDFTYLYYQGFTALSGGGFTAEFPSQYQLAINIYGATGNTAWGSSSWSALDGSYQAPNPPMFEAMRLFNNSKRRFRVKTG